MGGRSSKQRPVTREIVQASDVTVPIKTTVMGPSNAGKTAICKKVVSDVFVPGETFETVGAAYMQYQCKPLKYTDADAPPNFEKPEPQLAIWDCAGAERYHVLLPMYYRGAKLVFFVYDASDERSFESLKKMVSQVDPRGDGSFVKLNEGATCMLMCSRRSGGESVEERAASGVVQDQAAQLGAEFASEHAMLFREVNPDDDRLSCRHAFDAATRFHLDDIGSTRRMSEGLDRISMPMIRSSGKPTKAAQR